ncbi:MAG: serine/threonine-protein kinase [Candidatus Obscuribacterales bacterium]
MSESDQKQSHPLLGAVIDKYQLIDVLGSGGMGVVFKARQQLVDRDVAMKLLPPELGRDETSVSRLTREAKALAKLSHPNIVGTFDFGLTQFDQPYLVLEYVVGEQLFDILENERRLEPQRALAIFVQIAEAMDFAHKKGIIHRDLKPQNIMLTDQVHREQVKILDFGIATLADERQRLTRTGQVVGSPIYMSPEYCKGAPATTQSDIYSLGVLMYRALTGENPHRGKSLQEIFMAKCTTACPSFEQSAPGLGISPLIEQVVVRCLELEPANRFESMASLASALKAVQVRQTAPVASSVADSARPPAKPRPSPSRKAVTREGPVRGRSKTVIFVLVVLGLVVCLVGMAFVERGGLGIMNTKSPAPEKRENGSGFSEDGHFRYDSGKTVK